MIRKLLFLTLAAVAVLLTAKLSGAALSWWVVCSPLMVAGALALAVPVTLAIVFVVVFVKTYFVTLRQELAKDTRGEAAKKRSPPAGRSKSTTLH